VALLGSAPARAESLRPRFQIAVGMGLSLDGPPNPAPDDPVPAYFFSAGLGAGLLGLELRSFANAGDKQQVVRISAELVAVVRPLAPALGDRPGYGFRVLRSLSFTAGPATEKVGLGVDATWRTGGVGGVHVDLPVGPSGSDKELRLRLGARRMVAESVTVTAIPIRDSELELYAQIAFVF
jgi:hypothetical protein